jgi:hypothetical protein
MCHIRDARSRGLFEKPIDAIDQNISLGQLAFPYDHYLPPSGYKSSVVILIAFNIAGEFVVPIVLPGGGLLRFGTTLMPVPEAPIDKNHLMPSREDNIWLTRKAMQM